MPIRPELRHFYRGAAWRATRERILARAEHKCEGCGAPNHTTVLRALDWWTPASLEATVFYHRGRIRGHEVTELEWHTKTEQGELVRRAHFPLHSAMKWASIQLGVAHLNHVAGDDRDGNLKALCRRCHILHDRGKHKATRSERKDRGRPLIVEAIA